MFQPFTSFQPQQYSSYLRYIDPIPEAPSAYKSQLYLLCQHLNSPGHQQTLPPKTITKQILGQTYWANID